MIIAGISKDIVALPTYFEVIKVMLSAAPARTAVLTALNVGKPSETDQKLDFISLYGVALQVRTCTHR